MPNRLLAACASVAAALLWHGSAVAQTFPDRPVTIIVSYAAGGPSDIVARALGQSMSATLGQAVPIENVAGAGDFLFDQTIGAIPQIEAGTIKAFAVTSGTRLAQLKNLPTMQEAGLERFEVIQWHALYAPAGTPKAALDKLGAALEVALKDPTIVKRFTELGGPPFPEGKRGAAEARAMLKSQVETWTRVIRSAGVTAAK
jgi:tripartite-type tricarboxylate transporter receptor subunit TctC